MVQRDDRLMNVVAAFGIGSLLETLGTLQSHLLLVCTFAEVTCRHTWCLELDAFGNAIAWSMEMKVFVSQSIYTYAWIHSSVHVG